MVVLHTRFLKLSTMEMNYGEQGKKIEYCKRQEKKQRYVIGIPKHKFC